MPDTKNDMRISNWKPREKNTLRGFFSLTLPSGLIIRDVMLHEKGDRRWISLPAREYVDANGKRTFATFLDFTSQDVASRFYNSVLAALEQHFAEVANS